MRSKNLQLTIALALLIAFIISCKEKDNSLSVCNSLLNSCAAEKNVPYCTFGYKFGESNPFSPAGASVPGPQVKASTISYKFQEAGLVFNTHSQEGVTSKSFNSSDTAIIKLALSYWAAVANIQFKEAKDAAKTDITIIKATISQNGIGYSAFVTEPCNQIAGFLILSEQYSNYVNKLYLPLHEIGHVLGLGHVFSENVMNPKRTFERLQSGDIEGVQSIYGKK